MESTCVINVRDGEVYLEYALRSALSQTSETTVIAVDNQSTDRTWEIIKSHPKVRGVQTNCKLSLGEARNYGLQYVESKYVGWLDADDIWRPDFVEKHLRAFHENPQVGLISSGAIEIGSSGDRLSKRHQRWFVEQESEEAIKGDALKDILLKMSFLGPWSSFMFRTEVVKEVGGFNEGMTFAEDFDLISKVLIKWSSLHIPLNLCQYRRHPMQSSVNDDPRIIYDEILQVLEYSMSLNNSQISLNSLERIRSIIWFKRSSKSAIYHKSLREAIHAIKSLGDPSVQNWVLEQILIRIRSYRMIYLYGKHCK